MAGITAFAADPTYTWTIDEFGTLTIDGTGAVDFGQAYYQPWKNDVNSIKAIVVNEGITSLGRGTFENLKYVTIVSLPESLKSIGYSAFSGCTHLQSVTLPERLELVDREAFANCTSLTEITIPASVTTMSSYTFSGCSSLIKAEFKNSLSMLPEQIFNDCTSLTEVIFPDEVSSLGNYCFSDCTSLEKIVIPDTVTVLGSGAFSGCTSLSEVNTENILEYNSCVFEGCTALDTIVINETVKTIASSVFQNSGITHLVLPENLQRIDSRAFSGCAKLESVNLPDKLTRLDAYVFEGCVSLKEISIPSKITSLGDKFFEGCTALSKVTLHDDMTRIGYNAFKNCPSLKNITLPSNLEYLGYEAFNGTGITEITIPESLTTAGHGEGLSSGLFPYDYNKGPFGGSPLETVYFESGVTEIPAGLFQGAQKLKNVDLSNIEIIGAYAFSNCAEFVPVLTEKTTEIGNYAFTRCTAIEDFEYPSWMTEIPNGLLAGTSIGYVVFPERITKIGNDAYKGCQNLSYIEFSSTITDIGNYAFSGCTALDSIDIPGTVINIGNSAFADCTNLKELIMHKGTQTLGGSAFANCSLTEIRPSQTIRTLNDMVFDDNPVELLVVPRFCVNWKGDANYYNSFRPAISYVPSNVESFDIWMHQNGVIIAAEGTAGHDEATREAADGRNVSFEPFNATLEVLSFDKDYVEISLDETYDAAAIVTAIPEEIDYPSIGSCVMPSPEGRAEIDTEVITFSSDNEEVATVDGSGFVHGVGYGTATITISCDSGITDTFTVNVVRPGIGVQITPGYTELEIGKTVTLKADTIPAGYKESFTWSSSDESIATVTQNGVVTAIKEGTVIISAAGYHTEKTAKSIVTVVPKEVPSYNIEINDFVVGCNVSVSDLAMGGKVIAALYDGENRVLDIKVFTAEESNRVEFTVSRDVDLTDAKIRVFWLNAGIINPISQPVLIELKN